jgi:catechol 2,3-dioxygenase-like lactoylglutathione lyase family enzyme
MIRCNLSSVLVHDQQVAEDFYVGKLGFTKKHDFPAGGARWLTVIAADGSGAEVLLEPSGFDFSKAYQKALHDKGIPLTSFGCDDVQAEYERLVKLDVTFRGEPTKHADDPTTVVFEDGCGNLIMLVEIPAE